MNRRVEFKPTFGAFILETLTLGMYGETKTAIREYVQNAFDSLQEAVGAGLISRADAAVEVAIGTDKNSLVIRDNGVGLRTEAAAEVLASVGASNKSYAKNAGFRGIGRLAGIVFCDLLTFSTKAAGQTDRTVIKIDARALRAKLSPESGNTSDAARTLADCVDASIEPTGEDAADHYFEVRLEGFYEAPVEATDIGSLKSFLRQVSPLPFAPDFPFAEKINKAAAEQWKPLETIRVRVRDGTNPAEEIFKPYGPYVSVKNKRVALTDVDIVRSPSGKWWGWISKKRTSGTIKDVDTRGIRVRMKNIQIDDTHVMREIFAISKKANAPSRLSYGRFAEWYQGEIHVSPAAAVPNARRDGFEENEGWHVLRAELEVEAGKLGSMAYKTSKADQLSVENITKRLEELKANIDALKPGNWDELSLWAAEAIGIDTRLGQAAAFADSDEQGALRELHSRNLALKARVQELIVDGPAVNPCKEEIEQALSSLTQKLYTTLRQRLGPSEWRRVMQIVQEVSGESPE